MEGLRVLIADDHPIFRHGLAQSLTEAGLTVCGEAGTADGVVAAAADLSPDLILLDLSMPGGGLDALNRLLARRPEQKVLVLTASEDDDDILSALGMGACGYALKGVGSSDLVDIIVAVANGAIYAPPAHAGRLVADLAASRVERSDRRAQAVDRGSERGADLNPRELAIMTLLAGGASNKLIARSIGVEEKTVKNHMTRIMTKLGVRNRVEAALLFQSRSLG